jgi:hypothetical protein
MVKNVSCRPAMTLPIQERIGAWGTTVWIFLGSTVTRRQEGENLAVCVLVSVPRTQERADVVIMNTSVRIRFLTNQRNFGEVPVTVDHGMRKTC